MNRTAKGEHSSNVNVCVNKLNSINTYINDNDFVCNKENYISTSINGNDFVCNEESLNQSSLSSDSIENSIENNVVKILSLNCCGLKHRLQYPDFESLIRQHDIICLVETKTDDIDTLILNDYEFKMKNRGKFCGRKSGGITLAYKLNLKSKIKVLNSDSKFVLWFRVFGELFDIDEDVIFGIVYIPPENSRYSSESAFTELETEFLKFSNNYKYVALLGDFNGRTSDNIDYLLIKENKHTADCSYFINNDVFILDEIGISRTRNNMDKVKNNYGNKLLDFCKSNNLFIANGRVGADAEIGKCTCRNASVVDYCLSSAHFLKCIANFEVLDFNCLYSDVHTPLQLKLKGCNRQLVKDNNRKSDFCIIEKINKWENEKNLEYQNNIDNFLIQELKDKIIVESQNNIDKTNVNSLFGELWDIYLLIQEK